MDMRRWKFAERQAFLQKLEDRKHGSRSSVQKNVLVLAADFSPKMQNLRLPHRIDELITKLRKHTKIERIMTEPCMESLIRTLGVVIRTPGPVIRTPGPVIGTPGAGN